jgi:hypothetical protein
MPAKFTACVRNGGHVRTVKPKKGRYLHVCYPKGGGSPVAGEVKRNKRK